MSSFSPGQVVGGRYRIEREIGRGGMATVYLARDETHDRPVAVKVLLAAMAGVERFIDEIRTTAGLTHPNILTLLDSGQEGGSPYYVTDFIDGGSLQDRLEAYRRLKLDEVFRIGIVVASALAHAHSQGVIHRDVKPANILLDRAGNPYLADFGIARALAKDETLHTSDGKFIGTPRYMSPEQFGDHDQLDGTSDIYSLAAVLFETLTGEPVFKGRTLPAVAAAQAHLKLPSLRKLRPDLSKPLVSKLDELLRTALQRKPTDRVIARRSKATSENSNAAEFARRLSEISKLQPLPVGLRVLRAVSFVAGIMLVVGAVGLGVSRVVRPYWGRDLPPDTTRYAVLPLESLDGSVSDGVPADVLMEDALRRWEGITVVDRSQVEPHVSNASAAAGLSPEGLAEVARDVHAGRLVTVSARAVRDSVRVEARLLEPSSSVGPLEQYVFMVGPDGSGGEEQANKAAEALLLRTRAPRSDPLVNHTRSVAAARQFLLGDSAREDWSLAEAERRFTEAVTDDPDFDLALFWNAQVMSWEARPTREWEVDARRAAQNPGRLSDRERTLVRALVAMADSRYPEACALYDGLRQLDGNDFAAWFGLGECLRRDPIVVPDADSRTGWSFRASGNAAVEAYRRAFQLLPSSFRAFGPATPDVTRGLLYAETARFRPGQSAAPNSRVFFGFREWRGDTLAFVAVPADSAPLFGNEQQAQSDAEARTHQRRAVLDVANEWARAFPTSSGALYTLAVARELVGDESAIDTYHEARVLADVPSIRAEIGIAEVVMRVRLSTPSDPSGLRAAVSLADTILSSAYAGRLQASGRLAELAVLLGRPNLAARMARAAVTGNALVAIPTEVTREAEALRAYAAVGAPQDSIRAVANRTERLIEQSVPPADVRGALQRVLEQPSFLAFPADTLDYLSNPGLPVSPYARAIAALASGDNESALRTLGAPLGGEAWDVLLAQANIQTRAGRADAALALLRSRLGDLATADPANVRGMPSLGGVVRAIALRAELEDSLGSREAGEAWAQAARILWSTGEESVAPVLERLRIISSSQDPR